MHRGFIWAFFLNLAFASAAAAQPAARNVLLLNSFERDFAPHTVYTERFRNELSGRSPAPINFFEVSIKPAPFGASQEEPIVNYLLSTLTGQQLDLVVTIGGPSAAFAQKYRERLFATTPVLRMAVDWRRVKDLPVNANDTTVAAQLDVPEIIRNILVVRPETTRVYVVIGTSQFEQYWQKELAQEFEPFKDRLEFVWFNELSFAEMLKRAPALPPRSAIFFALLSLDARGVVQTEERTLAQLHAVTNAPIFGLYDIQLGRGIVGGPLAPVVDSSRLAADVALRILAGESPGNISTPPQPLGLPVYDWRELQRWGISEARLPAGSTVRFRQPRAWDQYKPYIVGAIVILALQSALIAGLVVQRRRSLRSEMALRESEERFRLMANGAPVMVWTATPDMATDFFNSTVLEFSGLPLEQLLGDGWLHRIHPDDTERCQNNYQPAFEQREPFQMEYRFRRADGTYRWVLDTGVPRYDHSGQFVGYIGSALDITDRREMEQSLVANQAALQHAYEQNQDLAGRLIHAQEAERTRIARDLHDDVSQQLAGVGIMLSGLKRNLGRPAPQGAEETVAMLQERTSSLAFAIRNLSHELHPGLLKHAGLAAALRKHIGDVQHHGLAVTLKAGDDLESLDFDVALCLYRVTQEALTNVIRHAQASLAVVEVMRTATGVELSVIDDGRGFVTSERTRTGLGLRSIDERVRLTRGQLTLESRPGQGTMLLVRVPLESARVALARGAEAQVTLDS